MSGSQVVSGLFISLWGSLMIIAVVVQLRNPGWMRFKAQTMLKDTETPNEEEIALHIKRFRKVYFIGWFPMAAVFILGGLLVALGVLHKAR